MAMNNSKLHIDEGIANCYIVGMLVAPKVEG